MLFLWAGKASPMIYQHIEPTTLLSPYIKSFWLVDSESDTTPSKQKIIPDGYPELIFHYGDPFRIKIAGTWQLQEQNLLAGQIRNHFHLENTGKSGMIGMKLMPSALSKLFSLNMSSFKDKVVSLSSVDPELLRSFALLTPSLAGKDKFIESIQSLISDQLGKVDNHETSYEVAVKKILESNGSIPVTQLCKSVNISERQLERQFLKHIGLSPKFYARIIRFSYIFELMQKQDQSWSDLVYQSGFYDQSHFIKNFKEFTGEDPSAYGFNEQNMANFHLNR